MGYCIDQIDAEFFMDAANFPAAVKAMQELAKKKLDHHWVSSQDFADLTDIVEILDAWRWETVVVAGGNIDNIQFVGEKFGDDFTLFKTIAPFVKSGSFIEMQGEDGERWRWVFDGETCKEIYPKVQWDN